MTSGAGVLGSYIHLSADGLYVGSGFYKPPPKTLANYRQAVDDALQISVYRIVQEALTNVRKHAAGADATVMIRYRRDAVDIEVANVATTTPSTRAVAGAGQGLIGIRERASLFGGTVEAGATAEGGFAVSVRLPSELVPA